MRRTEPVDVLPGSRDLGPALGAHLVDEVLGRLVEVPVHLPDVNLDPLRVRGVDHGGDLVAVRVELPRVGKQGAVVMRQPGLQAVRIDRAEAVDDQSVDGAGPVARVRTGTGVLPDGPVFG